MAKKRWKDLPPWARTVILVVASVQVSLFAAAQADISRRSADEINGSKLTWRLISLINIAGPLCYFLRGRARRSIS